MPARGRGRKDNESDNGTDIQDAQVTFETYRDEGEHFTHVKQYKRAIASFTKALDMQPGDRVCLVRRSNCYLMLGNAEKALADANECLEQDEDGKKDIKALCMKAEALYQRGDFEQALVFYHRGRKQRPELQEFRLGIQKSQEAINNSIGTPDSVKLETSGDLSYFYKQEEKQKQQQSRGYSKPQTKKEDKKERKRPQSSGNSKTTKELLGELFADKEYLETLYDSMMSTNSTDTTEFIKERACDGLEYLGVREDFWRQQKPMYARKRDKKKQIEAMSGGEKGSSSSGTDPMKYILTRLEQIDEAHADGCYGESVQKCEKTLKRLNDWSDEEVKNKKEVIANLHSCMGNAFLEMGKYDEALKHHETDLDIGKTENLEEVKSRALDNMGRVLARMGNYEKAIKTWEEKLPLSKTALEKTWLYHEIGRCYLEISQYGEARDYGEKSLAAAKEASDDSWQLHACVLVAQSEVKCNDLQAAADSFERALEMAHDQKDSAAEQAIKKALEDVNDKIVCGVQENEREENEDEKKDGDEGEDKGEKYEEDFEEEEGNQKTSYNTKVEVEMTKEDSGHDTMKDEKENGEEEHKKDSISGSKK